MITTCTTIIIQINCHVIHIKCVLIRVSALHYSTAFTYYVTLVAKRMCASLHHPLKLLLSALLWCTDSSQPGWFHFETYMHVLWL